MDDRRNGVLLLDGDEPAEEEILTGTRLPRWVSLTAAVAVAALLVAVLVTRGVGGHPAANPLPTAGTPTQAGQQVPPAASTTATFDVAIAPSGSWVLEPGVQSGVLRDRDTGVHATVRGLPVADPDSLPRIVADPARELVWLVVMGGRSSWMIEFDARTGRELRSVAWVEPIRSAAAYQGSLYVTTDRGAAVLDQNGGLPRFLPGLSGGIGVAAADPTRHRLIFLDFGYPTDVWTYRPGGQPVEAAGTLPFGKGSIAVAGGAIWVGGFGNRGAVLERLDPQTLRPVAASPQAATFSPGAIIVAGGKKLIWLGAGSGGSSSLSCMNAGTGRVAHTFWLPAVNGVASDGSRALAATATGLLELPLADCGLGVSGHVVGSNVHDHALR